MKLKSGGPEMTVEETYDDYDSCKCQWFAGKKLETGSFPYASLERAPVKAPIPAPGTGRAGA
ncbi:hypothetical protein DB31_5982 [Hyalangium minutum]|uniref:Uncharacterized protein n=1 Tax=Hyalangium minutum TaxID=394096 RepID=A0A085VXE8_9BACT|nr:hypothetical protein DB31_5982 [Hyalangium minutum]